MEEAYNAIRPMYAVHKGKYTTLCMYLCARDVFNIRLNEGHIDEAHKIFEAIRRLVPRLEDTDGYVASFMLSAEQRLASSSASSVSSGSPAAITATVPDCSPSGLNKGQQAVLDCIKANEGINVPKLSELTNIPSKSIERHISVLIARNLIEHRGSKKTGGYHALYGWQIDHIVPQSLLRDRGRPQGLCQFHPCG